MNTDPPPFREDPPDWFGRGVLILIGLVVGAAISAGAITLTDPAAAKIRTAEKSAEDANHRARTAEDEVAAIRKELHESQEAVANLEAEIAKPQPTQPIPTATELVDNEGKYTEISASKLLAECKENEVAAESRYAGQKIIIHGKVDTVGRDLLGSAYLTFDTGEDTIGQVQCMFDDPSELASLSHGSGVSVAGELSGVAFNVIVRGCSLVE